ncbi:MerR family transcriptional regulator [Geothermobacter hydrogeniphilus]|uniref:HTH merR-type domain-containing protein n=1 Tax=Geothermobacter hydrogeniphilus TaxID=1969733 RepID=A0A1X0XX15_9BACT|nr:MerR family transcriptional regulator [Geothermobacter hydrogeniphilus]ORJ57427.1 hypothetical protein B5V00_13925 [Geothermobacter hydrogeniphilus]
MSTPKKNAHDRQPGLRMSELVRQTGLPKSTILYYLDQGLLPQPVKTSPNMAYYAPECVPRLAQIKTLQTRHRLPLQKIGKLLELKDQGQEITPFIELHHAIFGDQDGPLLGREAFCQRSGLTPEQLAAFEKAGLLLPLSREGFDQQDLAMGILYARGLARGITPEEINFYPTLGKQIVDREMALRNRITGPLPADEDAAATLQLVQAARATRSYVIDRLFQRRVAASSNLKDESLLS